MPVLIAPPIFEAARPIADCRLRCSEIPFKAPPKIAPITPWVAPRLPAALAGAEAAADALVGLLGWAAGADEVEGVDGVAGCAAGCAGAALSEVCGGTTVCPGMPGCGMSVVGVEVSVISANLFLQKVFTSS